MWFTYLHLNVVIDKQVPAMHDHDDNQQLDEKSALLITDYDTDLGGEATTSRASFTRKYMQLNHGHDAPSLVDFRKFICGLPMPPKHIISISFSTDDTQTFPVAETCFVWLVFPTTHISFDDSRP